jgi:hypothetical protein
MGHAGFDAWTQTEPMPVCDAQWPAVSHPRFPLELWRTKNAVEHHPLAQESGEPETPARSGGPQQFVLLLVQPVGTGFEYLAETAWP